MIRFLGNNSFIFISLIFSKIWWHVYKIFFFAGCITLIFFYIIINKMTFLCLLKYYLFGFFIENLFWIWFTLPLNFFHFWSGRKWKYVQIFFFVLFYIMIIFWYIYIFVIFFTKLYINTIKFIFIFSFFMIVIFGFLVMLFMLLSFIKFNVDREFCLFCSFEVFCDEITSIDFTFF